MLKQLFPEDSEDIQSSFFVQDGAPAHTSRLVLDWLEMTFLERLISNKWDYVAPRSPDLNACDFFFFRAA